MTLQTDITFRDGLANNGWKNPETKPAKLAEWLCVDNEYAGPIERLSVFHNLLEEFTLTDFGEQQRFVTD